MKTGDVDVTFEKKGTPEDLQIMLYGLKCTPCDSLQLP